MNEIIDRDLLIALPQPKDALSVFASEDGAAIEPFLQMVRAKIDAFKGDATTEAGRAAIKSMAHKVSKSKAALEEVGKALADEQKAIPKRIDATRKKIKDTLDAWRDEVRKPVDDWEAAEAARVAKHQAVLQSLQALASPSPAETLAWMKAQLQIVLEVALADHEEYADEISRAKHIATNALSAAIVAREKYDAEQAELIKLRLEKEERDRLDREADIRAQAADEERRRNEAKAQAERDAFAKREADLKAERDAAELRATQAAQKAVEDQRAKEAAEAEEAAKRERNRKHCAAINNAAVDALVAAGIDAAVAKQVVVLIAKKAVPAVSISY